MTPEEVAKIESEFGINFPDHYRQTLIKGLGYDSYVVDCDYNSLRESNLYPREQGICWALPWENHFWIVGGDGAGGFNLMDTSTQDNIIYYFDHEDCGISLSDAKVTTQTLDEIIEEDLAIQKEIEEEELIANKIRELKIRNRSWWQFWIPKTNKPNKK